ncbi:YheC/YheD family protein [Paenibacillus chartarius]|uniref:YheC/YheD family protein n=1 Tax=Paenibacillus chartarius TaxID=747481 RepID=A0ABV6DN67_9BACL
MNKKKLEELAFFQKLSQRGRTLGLDVLVFTAEDVKPDQTAIRALVFDRTSGKWIRRWTNIPDLIYDRCRYQGPVKYHQVKAFRNQFPKLIYLGRPLANKWVIYQYMSENDRIAPHLPVTVKFTGIPDTVKFIKKHKLVYLKPRNGTGGRGILRIEQTSSGNYLVQGRNANRVILQPQRISDAQLAAKLGALGLTEQYLVQQGINLVLPDGRVHDFRLLIQKNGRGQWDVTGCAGRIGAPRSITSNLHGGGTAAQTEQLLARRFPRAQVAAIERSMHRLAYIIADHLEQKYGSLCELGIDLAVDPKGHVWLLEVNPKPSREVFRKIGEKDVYARAISRPLEYALWLLKQRKQRRSE